MLHRASLLVGLLACTCVAWFVFHFDGFMGPDSGARFAMIRSWAHGGSPLFLDAAEHAGSARVTDPLIGYSVAVPHGVCVVYPPLFTIMSALSFFAFGRAGLVLLPVLGGLLAAYWTHRAAREWSLASYGWAPAILLLATPLVFYASTFWDHSIHMALVAAATWLLLRAYAGRTRDALLAGVVVGAGVWFHELLLAAAACMAVALIPRRALAWRFCVGVAVPVACWMAFNALVYGAVRGPHMMGPLEPFASLNLSHLVDASLVRERASTQLAGEVGRRATLFLALTLVLVTAGLFRAKGVAFAIACLLGLMAAWSMSEPGYATGLLQVTPWLLFAFADRPSGADWRDEAHRMLLRAALLFVVVVILTPVAPGLNWGGRYLLTMLPVYALLAMRTIERSWSRAHWLPLAFYGLLAAFVFVRGVITYRAKVFFDRTHAHAMIGVDTRLTATDCWWLGPEMQPTNVSTSLALTAYVPATEQLSAPLPADPNRAIRDAFFARVAAAHLSEFSWVGTRPALIVMRVAARERGFALVEAHRDGDLAVARFSR